MTAAILPTKCGSETLRERLADAVWSDVTLKFDPIVEARRQWDLRWEGSAAMTAATSIMRAQQIILGRVDETLRSFDLTFARYEALVLLTFTRAGSLPLGKMGERLMVHPASVTKIVDRLTEQGLLNRVPHPTDRRAVLAHITDEGRQRVKVATDAVIACSLGMDGLEHCDLESLSGLLAKFRKAAGDFDDPVR